MAQRLVLWWNNSQTIKAMKKIDILNFITNFRKAPNDIKDVQRAGGAS